MIRLTREVRFSIDRDWVRGAHGEAGFDRALPINNSWGGWPSAVGIAPYLTLRATVVGKPDPVTGYLVNITLIDRLLRAHAIPLAARELAQLGVRATGAHLVMAVWDEVRTRTPDICRLVRLELGATPYLTFAIEEGAPDMVELTQEFEFSAAHRLHVASLSDAENREIFGKCNNPSGHGHNYRVQVTIAGHEPTAANGGGAASGGAVPGVDVAAAARAAADSGPVCGGATLQDIRLLPLPKLEAIVQRDVIDVLDHKHLNIDVPAFADLNPSVENIARVIWTMLEQRVAPATLRSIRVWETAKTCAEYRG